RDAVLVGGQDLGQDLERNLGRRLAAQVEPDRSANPVGNGTELLPALLLRSLRAERANVEGASLDTTAERRKVEPLLVHERDEGSLWIDGDLVGPRDDELVGARHTLAGGETRAWIDDDGAPAERPRERAQRFGDVTGADGHEARRRADCLDEHASPGLLPQLRAS